MVPDGVFVRGDDGHVVFRRLPAPDDDDIDALLRQCASRVLRLLRRELDDDEPDADALAALEAASLKARPAANGDGPKKKRLTAFLEGFSLHAGVHLHENDRRGLEQLCRYGARGAIALSRLSELPDRRVAYHMKRPLPDGRTHLMLTGVELLRKLAPLIPPPRMHLLRFHGVFAPNSKLRSLVVPKPPAPAVEEGALADKPPARPSPSPYRTSARTNALSGLPRRPTSPQHADAENPLALLDDFVRAFHGGGAGGKPELVPYTFDELCAALDAVVKNDWKSFFRTRLDATSEGHPLDGLTAAGWRIGWVEERPATQAVWSGVNKVINEWFSIGLLIGSEDQVVRDVRGGSEAYRTGIAPGMKILGVDGRTFAPELLDDALKASNTRKAPLELLVGNGSFYRVAKLDYHQGKRYPRLERDPAKPDVLSQILAPKTPHAAPLAAPHATK